jgi:hypothetical protein
MGTTPKALCPEGSTSNPEVPTSRPGRLGHYPRKAPPRDPQGSTTTPARLHLATRRLDQETPAARPGDPGG